MKGCHLIVRLIAILFTLVLFPLTLSSTIVGSKHDLSVTNEYGNYYGDATTQVCIFCHTPHNSNSDLAGTTDADAPIWNRKLTDTTTFQLYDNVAGTPSSISMACLSCHDGVAATGEVSAVNSKDVHVIINAAGPGSIRATNPNCSACHPFAQPAGGGLFPRQAWQIGPDLTNDHPVSIDYATSVAHLPGEFLNDPINGVKLFEGKVECASCHNVHDGNADFFLRTANTESDLCQSCHQK